ncbi:hypothetical protein TetV_259 [Tetraselmis virus 1]|uniref:Uncharacterized protein n=1 Tax=Tetraselmis virus 1 TaxID=2060617 RepID=A0A2P0VN80_9VIRU|nr:hypothetical protein QJ968_gp259 [Tetraselmis virus 1]AUF82351.1 hypothetical protein TetV_259 [Tetraselmis virus 1]
MAPKKVVKKKATNNSSIDAKKEAYKDLGKIREWQKRLIENYSVPQDIVAYIGKENDDYIPYINSSELKTSNFEQFRELHEYYAMNIQSWLSDQSDIEGILQTILLLIMESTQNTNSISCPNFFLLRSVYSNDRVSKIPNIAKLFESKGKKLNDGRILTTKAAGKSEKEFFDNIYAFCRSQVCISKAIAATVKPQIIQERSVLYQHCRQYLQDTQQYIEDQIRNIDNVYIKAYKGRISDLETKDKIDQIISSTNKKVDQSSSPSYVSPIVSKLDKKSNKEQLMKSSGLIWRHYKYNSLNTKVSDKGELTKIADHYRNLNNSLLKDTRLTDLYKTQYRGLLQYIVERILKMCVMYLYCPLIKDVSETLKTIPEIYEDILQYSESIVDILIITPNVKNITYYRSLVIIYFVVHYFESVTSNYLVDFADIGKEPIDSLSNPHVVDDNDEICETLAEIANKDYDIYLESTKSKEKMRTESLSVRSDRQFINSTESQVTSPLMTSSIISDINDRFVSFKDSENVKAVQSRYKALRENGTELFNLIKDFDILYEFMLSSCKTHLDLCGTPTLLIEKLTPSTYISSTFVSFYEKVGKNILGSLVSKDIIPENAVSIGLSTFCFNLLQRKHANKYFITSLQEPKTKYIQFYSNIFKTFSFTNKFYIDQEIKTKSLNKYNIYGVINDFIHPSWLNNNKSTVSIFSILCDIYRTQPIANKDFDTFYKEAQTKYMKEQEKASVGAKDFTEEYRMDQLLPYTEQRFSIYTMLSSRPGFNTRENPEIDLDKYFMSNAKVLKKAYQNNESIKEAMKEIIQNVYPKDSPLYNFYVWTVDLYIGNLEQHDITFPFHLYDWDYLLMDKSPPDVGDQMTQYSKKISVIDQIGDTLYYSSCKMNCNAGITDRQLDQCNVNYKSKCEVPFTNSYDLKNQNETQKISKDMMVNQSIYYRQGNMMLSYGGSGVGKTTLFFGQKAADIEGLIANIYSGLESKYPFKNDPKIVKLYGYEIYRKKANTNVSENLKYYAIEPSSGMKGFNPAIAESGIVRSFNKQGSNKLTPLCDNSSTLADVDGKTIIETVSKMDANFYSDRMKNVDNEGKPIEPRIRPTVNNPESSRSVMVYIILISYGDIHIPIVLVDLPGYEIIEDKTDSEGINKTIQESMNYMTDSSNTDFINLLIPIENVDYLSMKTSAFVIANTKGANPTKLNSLKSMCFSPSKQPQLIDNAASLTTHNYLQFVIGKMLLAYGASQRKDLAEDDRQAITFKLFDSDNNTWISNILSRQPKTWSALAAVLKYNLAEYYIWLQKDQRFFLDLYSSKFKQISNLSIK